MGKPLRQQRQDMLDLLDDILGNPASKLDRLHVLREAEATAKRMADGMARGMLTEWLEVAAAANVDHRADWAALNALLTAPEDGGES